VQSLALQDDELAAARTPVLKRLKARASR